MTDLKEVLEISNTTGETTLSQFEQKLVQWEEFAISLEEHFHAHDLFLRNPNAKPLGHH